MRINLIEKALNLIFPPVCGFCNEMSDSYLCEYCSNYLKSKQINRIDLYEDKFFTTHLWLFKYEDEIREKIIDYKFNDRSYLYRTFTQIILSNKDICDYISFFDIIIPVPIHKKRKKSRGYNQSELIARGITEIINSVELRIDLITKMRNIKPQSTLNKDERIKNVSDSYRSISGVNLNGKKVLLMDDVYTTGSTVNECAKVLIDLNCGQIGVMTLAKD